MVYIQELETESLESTRYLWLAALVVPLGGCPPEVQSPRRVVARHKARPTPPRLTPPPKPRFTGARRYVYTGPAESGRTADFSPDGKLLAVGGAFGQIHLVDLRTGKLRRTLQSGGVGVSPDSKRLVEVGGVDDLAVYDVRRGKRLWQRQGHPHRKLEVMALRFAPDSKRLLSYHRTGFVRVFDATTGQRVGHRRIRMPPGIVSCALRPDTRVLACAVGSAIRFYEVATGALLRVVRPRSTGKVLGLGYSPDGATIVLLESVRRLRVLRFP